MVTKKAIATFNAHAGRGVLSVAFRPDVAGGREIATLEGQGQLVSSVVFSPDGKTLASARWDREGAVKLWEILGGRE